jgi:hypothetical protein
MWEIDFLETVREAAIAFSANPLRGMLVTWGTVVI